jgi:hypothetical protein
VTTTFWNVRNWRAVGGERIIFVLLGRLFCCFFFFYSSFIFSELRRDTEIGHVTRQDATGRDFPRTRRGKIRATGAGGARPEKICIMCGKFPGKKFENTSIVSD